MNLDELQGRYARFASRYDDAFAERQRPKFEALANDLPNPLPTPALDFGAGTGLAGRLLGAPFVMLDASR